MQEKKSEYVVGDWLVHKFYGVGQIINKEERPIQGETTPCFTVESKAGTYWIPVDKSHNQRVRPVMKKATLKKAINILNKAPQEMDQNYKIRRKRIKEVLSEGSIFERAELLRDLKARARKKGLNTTEEDARELIKEQLVREYAICMNTSSEIAKKEFNKLVS